MYCGAQPPDVVLEIDHIIARHNGGTDDPENLLTACFDCNRAKRTDGIQDGLILRKIMRENSLNFEQKYGEALYGSDVVDNWIESFTGMWGDL